MDVKILQDRLRSSDPGERIRVLDGVPLDVTEEQPERVVTLLAGALEDGDGLVRSAAVLALCRVGQAHPPALVALVQAVLRDDRLPEIACIGLGSLRERSAADVVLAELVQVLTGAHDDLALGAAHDLLVRLGPAGAKFLKRADLDAAAEALLQALPVLVRDSRLAAAAALVDLKVSATHLIEHVNTLPWPPKEQVEVQRYLARLQEEADRRTASARQKQAGEGSSRILGVLGWIFVLLGVASVVVPLVLAFPLAPVPVAITAVAILVVAAAVAALWFRCPHCGRWWAGRLRRVEYQRTSDTATVRDVHGVSHTVQTSRIRSTRHYHCRFCHRAFTR